MRQFWLVGAVLSALALSACQAPPPPPPAPAPIASADAFPGIKAAYEQANPKSLMGRVTAIRTQDSLLAVGDLDPSKVAVGDPVSILDAKMATLCLGTITFINADMVVVKYSPPIGPRGPEVGDLAVRAVQ